ncbi:FtsX-like permease family protein [Kitasatospora sp. NPDC002227]|uniref:FtsX-like permease family protein n=1 Tax=Kitasatospora sp. NPDC002227 TaxID=3154773 RepID=UPI003316AA7F
MTGFAVLTATSQTSRLTVTGTVSAHYRTQYDLLIRPKGSTTELERSQSLVRAGFLSDVHGGITLDQYRAVQGLPGVEVAAPIAMIGYVMPEARISVPLGKPSGGGPQVWRVRVNWGWDRGLSHLQATDAYVYLTPQALELAHTPDAKGGLPTTQAMPDGSVVTVCPQPQASDKRLTPGGEVQCVSTAPSAQAVYRTAADGTVTFTLSWPFPIVLAAIDPAAEQKLSGLGGAVATGRALTASDGIVSNPGGSDSVPVVAASSTPVDGSASWSVQELPPAASAAVVQAGGDYQALTAGLARISGSTTGSGEVTANTAYQGLLTQLTQGIPATSYWKAAPVSYTAGARAGAGAGAGGGQALTPESVTNPPDVWRSAFTRGTVTVPAAAADGQFRGLTPYLGSNVSQSRGSEDSRIAPSLRSVGSYDPSRLTGHQDAVQGSLDVFSSSRLTPADPQSSRLLRGQSLQPDGDPAGYAQQPPMMFTTLAALPEFGDPEVYQGADGSAPLSLVRVRVAGVTGVDALSRERVRQVAQEVVDRTGLDVDVVVGSSAAPVTVQLPAGSHGRPPLTLAEAWTHKGVAAVILAAIDRKSLVLFGLVLAVCAGFVANAAAASVRARRGELAILAAVGWTRPRIFSLVQAELASIGAAAGVVGALLAWPVAWVTGVRIGLADVVLAVPAAALLAVLAGLVPAWSATRVAPMEALRTAVRQRRRPVRSGRPGLARMAWRNLLLVPGRTALGAATLAMGVCATALVLTVTVAFHGVLVGNMLGQAVSVAVRGVDGASTALMLVLALLAVADLSYTNIKERTAQLALLQATGWTSGQICRLIAWESAGLGLAGSLAGGALAYAGTALFAGAVDRTALTVISAAVVVGTALAVLAGVAPALTLTRLHTARSLAEE